MRPRNLLGKSMGRRITALLPRTEGQEYPGKKPRRTPRLSGGASVVRAISTTTITACVGTTLGTGNADLWRNVSGTMTAGDNVDVVSWFKTAVPSGVHITLAFVDGNEYELVSADC